MLHRKPTSNLSDAKSSRRIKGIKKVVEKLPDES